MMSSSWGQVDLSNVYKNLEEANYEEVIEQLDAIKSKDKKFLETKYFLKGLSYSKLQEYTPSILEFKKSIAAGNQSGEIFYEFGQVLYAQNELVLSRKSFIRANEKKFKSAQSLYYIGHISQLLEEHKNAKTYFSKILKDKSASTEIRQIARFQMSESMIILARMSNNPEVVVEKYILPQLKKALATDKKSQVAQDILKRISEIENEFGLNPNLYKNGRAIAQNRLNISFSHELKYDNNFTLTSDLPETTQTKVDTFINTSTLELAYTFIAKRRVSIKPYLNFEKTTHSNREDSQIFSSDAYTIDTGSKLSFEHKAFKNPASFLLNFDYEYNAEDRLSNKEIIFNDRNHSIEFGERVKYFSFGETTFKLKFKTLSSYVDTSNYTATILSIDQILIKDKSLYVFLFLNNSSNYENDITSNTNSTTFRIDYLRPEFLPKTMLNIGASATMLNYEDEVKSETRGTEKTFSYNFKLSRDIRSYLVLDAEYTYTQNKSLVDASNYTKHETLIKLNLNY